MAGKRGPSKPIAIGCGIGCSLILLVVLVIFVIGIRAFAPISRTAETFVADVTSGDDDAAYGLLHPAFQAVVTRAEFGTQWAAARARLGTYQNSTLSWPATDPEHGQFTYVVELQGDKGSLSLDLTFQPKAVPSELVGYTLPADLSPTPPPAVAAPAAETTAPPAAESTPSPQPQ